MEPLWIGIIVFIVVFVLVVCAGYISFLMNKKKTGVFKSYMKQHFPDFPEEKPILTAKQTSKTMMLDIALIIDEVKKELILLFARKGEEMNHRIFPFRDLSAVESSDKIIGRGIFPKTYSYERTLVLKFNDGSSYNFILENISNRYGNDKGSDLIKNIFAPWEERLKKIIE
jgi:hypothetical protein